MSQTAAEKYQQFKKQYADARKQMMKSAKDAFKELATDLFTDTPKLQSFTWSQYTPYFNDGDSCSFGVNHYYSCIGINEAPSDDDADDDDSDAAPETSDLSSKERTAAAKAVEKFLRMFDDEILEDMFGDHAEITVHRDGRAEVEEYEHD